MNTGVIGILIRKYGQPVSYSYADGPAQSLRAFIQPISYKNRQYINDIHTPAGRVSTARYMYYGPPDVLLADDGLGEIISEGRRYRVCRSEMIGFGEAECYVRAVLEPGKEAAP